MGADSVSKLDTAEHLKICKLGELMQGGHYSGKLRECITPGGCKNSLKTP